MHLDTKVYLEQQFLLVVKQVIELKKIRIELLEEGLVENHFKSGDTIEVDDIIELRKENLKLMNSRPYTVLVTAEELTSFSRETREYIASKKFAGLTIAKALLISGLGQRIIGNFYMQVNRPFIKTRLFTEKDKALAWLRLQYQEFISSGRKKVYDLPEQDQ